MDILDPVLINIDGRIYCKYNAESHAQGSIRNITQNVDSWNDEPSCEAEINTTVSNEKTKLSLNIPSSLYKYIIGSKGDTKRRLEYETKTKIIIPGKGCSGQIIITGENPAAVASAKNRIDLIASSKRWKEPFTHFISIPLNTENVQQGLKNFETVVMKRFSSNQGLEQSLFQNPLKLHLTVCTLVLLNKEEEERAINHLKKVYDTVVKDVLGDIPLEINVRTLEYMNDDPAAVDVLYVKVDCLDGSDKLQILANRIAESFIEEGLAEKKYEGVKLHCTVMNTMFRKEEKDTTASNRYQRTRKSFDASRILMECQDFEFGRAVINEIHLSHRKTTSADGYYACLEKLVIN